MAEDLGATPFNSKTYTAYEVDVLLSRKQDGLTFDHTPSSGSDNPVTSNGIKGYVDSGIEAAIRDIEEKLSAVLLYRGSVPDYEDLPKEGVHEGYVYNVESDDMNVVCVGLDSNDMPVWDPLGPMLSGYLTKKDAAETYLSKTDASNTYLNKTDAAETYLSKDDASNTYLTQTDAEDTYLPKADMTWEVGGTPDATVQRQRGTDPIVEGTGNSAISKSSISEGSSNVAGLKGYRYINTGSVTNSLTFGVVPDGWAAGDVMSIVNDSKYADCATIASISGTTVTFTENLPFSSIVADTGWDAKTAWVSAKPSIGNVDLGYGAHAEGVGSKALNAAAHAEGRQTEALGQYAHAEGRDTKAQYCAHAEGKDTRAIGTQSHAEGTNTTAIGDHSHVEGKSTRKYSTGEDITLTSTFSLASGAYSHAEGGNSKALGPGSHAEGNLALASGDYSHAEGNQNTASGNYSHAEGSGTVASNTVAHSEGIRTTASGLVSHAEGADTQALSGRSHAEGDFSVAEGIASHAEGYHTKTTNDCEHAQGRFNASHKTSSAFGNAGNTLHSIGIGSGDSARKNAVEVMQDGKVYINGVGNYDGTNPGGNSDLATVISGKAGVDDVPTDSQKSSWTGKAEIESVTPAWYQEWDVTSTKQFTEGVAVHSFNTGTDLDYPYYAILQSFCNNNSSWPGLSENKHLVGDVVIPLYIYHDGKRYVVSGIVGVGDNNGYSSNTNLTSVVGPASLTSLRSQSFRQCTKLKKAVFPGVDYLEEHAFFGCTSLEELYIPRTKTVSFQALSSCSMLKSVFLPRVERIGQYAFKYSNNLEYVDFGSVTRSAIPVLNVSTTELALNIFPETCKLIVPDRNYNEWKSAAFWSELPNEFIRHSDWEVARKLDIPEVPIRSLKVNGGVIVPVDGEVSISVPVDRAPIDSPAFTGTPTAPTPTSGDSTTKVATTEFVSNAVSTAVSEKYTKPSSGIPAKDMAQAVQTSLQKADDALSRDEAEAGFTEWSLEDGVTPPGLQLSDQPYIAIDGEETHWAVPLVGIGDINIVGTPTDANATSLSWHGQKEGLEISFTATRTRLPTMTDLNDKQDTITDLYDIRAGAAAGAMAVQLSDLATVATSGSYDDLSNKPTIPAAQVNANWNETNAGSKAFIQNKPTNVSVFTNDAGYLTQHQDISGKLDKSGGTMTGKLTLAFADAGLTIADTSKQQRPTVTISPYGIDRGIRTNMLPAGDGTLVTESFTDDLWFKEWFPGGEAKSIDDCASASSLTLSGRNNTYHTIKVSFPDTLSGKVVVPPYVELENADLPFLERFTVVGVVGTNGYPALDITELVLPTTVSSLEGYSFSSFEGLKSVTMPSVESAGEAENGFVFAACTSLKSISLPKLSGIPGGTFDDCVALESASFESATFIREGAFATTDLEGMSLKSVYLPKVTEIYSDAFYNCKNLELVDFGQDAHQTIPDLDTDAFTDLLQSGHTCRIVIPDSQFTEWTTNQDWAALTSKGYEFVKHSDYVISKWAEDHGVSASVQRLLSGGASLNDVSSVLLNLIPKSL